MSSAEFLRRVAQEHEIASADLLIADRADISLSLTGVTLNAAKVVDTHTGAAYLVALDHDGREIDLQAAVAAEQNASSVVFGKLDPRLHQRMTAQKSQGDGDERISVSLWLNVPEPPLQRDRSSTDPRAEASERLRAVRDFVRPRREPVIDKLTDMGVAALVPRYAPAVFGDLTPAEIEEISQHPDVATIYGPEEYVSFQEDATTTSKAYRLWRAKNLGAGPSSRPVIHEDDGVSDTNPYLHNTTHPVIYMCSSVTAACPLGKNIDNHASSVAGVIAGTHTLYRGIAPSAQTILSANTQNFSDANLVDGIEWGRANGGDPINMSWGTICGGFQTFMSRYVDWAIKNLSATFVIAAGNHPSGCSNATNDEKVAAPALAWGPISVGSYSDGNNGWWSGDAMSSFTDWRNPDFATAMEKPEIAAVGQDIRTTDAQGGDHLTPSGVNGTSFAAPEVAGQVVSMLARQPGQNQWPETNKAAVLASAYQNIEAGTTRDGIGGVVMNHSDTTYLNNFFINDCAASCGLLTAGSFPRTHLDAMSLTAGQRVRAVIAWTSNSNGSSSDVLGADLDLRVRHPDNSTIVATSASIQNAWEMVDFVAPVTGTYDILVDRTTSDPGWPGTFLGIAWSIRSIPNFCTTATPIGEAGLSLAFNTTVGGTYFDSYSGWGVNQGGREQVFKLTLANTKDIAFTDTNSLLDLHILQFPNCFVDPIVPTVLASGQDNVALQDATPGVYYLVVDGANGAVGKTTINVGLSGP